MGKGIGPRFFSTHPNFLVMAASRRDERSEQAVIHDKFPRTRFEQPNEQPGTGAVYCAAFLVAKSRISQLTLNSLMLVVDGRLRDQDENCEGLSAILARKPSVP